MIFFFNDTATTEIYTLSLHDALPIFEGVVGDARDVVAGGEGLALAGQDHAAGLDPVVEARHRLGDGAEDVVVEGVPRLDRKSTRLNSSHANISYAVFCLKKKKKQQT